MKVTTYLILLFSMITTAQAGFGKKSKKEICPPAGFGEELKDVNMNGAWFIHRSQESVNLPAASYCAMQVWDKDYVSQYWNSVRPNHSPNFKKDSFTKSSLGKYLINGEQPFWVADSGENWMLVTSGPPGATNKKNKKCYCDGTSSKQEISQHLGAGMWILTREENEDLNLIAQIMKKAEVLGLDVTQFVQVSHKDCNHQRPQTYERPKTNNPLKSPARRIKNSKVKNPKVQETTSETVKLVQDSENNLPKKIETTIKESKNSMQPKKGEIVKSGELLMDNTTDNIEEGKSGSEKMNEPSIEEKNSGAVNYGKTNDDVPNKGEEGNVEENVSEPESNYENVMANDEDIFFDAVEE